MPSASRRSSTGVHDHEPQSDGLDRTLRIVVGLTLIGLAATVTVCSRGQIGLVPGLAGVASFCPACPLFGMSGCSMKKAWLHQTLKDRHAPDRSKRNGPV